MKGKGTLLLLIIFVALCAGYWGMLQFERRGLRQDFESKRLLKCTPEAITQLELQRLGQPLVVGVREAGTWKITKPNPAIEPNPVVWERAAAAAANLLNYRAIDATPENIATFGFETPVLTVRLKAEDTEHTLLFGSLDPTQKFRYARLDDGPVALTEARMFTELDRGLDTLRNPYIITVGQEGVNRLEFARIYSPTPEQAAAPDAPPRQPGEESIEVAVERQNGQWRLVAPVQAAANQEAVEALIKEVQFTVAHDYIDDPGSLDAYGLNPPRARLTIYGADKKPQTIYLGSVKSNDPQQGSALFAKNADRPSVYVIDAQVLTLLPKKPDSFRESRLFSGDALKLATIEYTRGDTRILLTQDERTGWTVTDPPIQDTDQIAISNFITLIKALQGDTFPGDEKPEYGLQAPQIAITLTPREGDPKHIAIGAPISDTGQHYARQDNGVVTLLSPLSVNALTKDIKDFRKLSLMEFPRDEAIELLLDINGVRYHFERPRGQWALKEPANHILTSASDLDFLLKTVANIRANELETPAVPADLTPYGLDKPAITIAVTLRENKKLGPLTIGAVCGNDAQYRFAATTNTTGVYRISQTIIDDIREAIKAVRPM